MKIKPLHERLKASVSTLSHSAGDTLKMLSPRICVIWLLAIRCMPLRMAAMISATVLLPVPVRPTKRQDSRPFPT